MMFQEQVTRKLTPRQYMFFNHLSMYIDKDLYFYGSIARADYIASKSDIDLAIFTDNDMSTIYQLCNVLNIKKNEFKKTVYRIGETVVHGFKVRYADPSREIETEISVYDDKYKSLVIQDQKRSDSLPFYVTFLLYIVKILFYDLHIISKKGYKRVKRFLMSADGEVNFIEVL